MQLICPHCQNPIELIEVSTREEVSCPTCGRSFRLEEETTIGWSPPEHQKLGRFELLEPVGVGAFGTVYKARDPELDRTVAIKIPRGSNLPEAHELQRFLREARSVAQLRHPSIVTVHEAGQAGNVPYLVSDFVEGLTLADLLSARRPAVREAARLIAEVADALQYAHEHGIIHRDIKPSNIMLERAAQPAAKGETTGLLLGTPRLMDFGLAKRDAGETTITMDGQVLGTPAYMSPEQARGESHNVDGRSDVYSLGVILYQMLTGELPFRGTKRMLLHQVLYDDPRPPRKLNDHIPRDLETICLKSMAKEPGRRYQTAKELADDLRRFLGGEPIQARPVGRVEKLWRWCRRNPAVATSLASIVFLLLVLGVGASIAAVLWREQRDTALANLGRAERAERDKTEKLWQSYRDQARAGRWSGQVGRRFNSLQALARAAEIRPDLELRNEAVACMALPDLRLVRPWPEQPPGTLGSTFFDARLQRCATSDAQGNISIRHTDEGREILRLAGPGSRAWSIKFSPDGRLLAARYHPDNRPSSAQLYLWDLRSREAALKIPAVHVFDISGNSRWLAVGRLQGTIQLYDLRSTKGEFKALPPGPFADGLAFHPDGRSLAVWSSQPPAVQVHDVESGKVLMTFSHPSAPRAVAWHPDGKLLAVGCSHPDRRVHVWDILSRQEKTLEGHQADVVQVVFNPAGDLLLSSSWDGTTRLWDPFGARQLVTVDGSLEGVSIDGRQVAMAGGLWELAPGSECRTLYGHQKTGKGPWSVDFSPDGRLLASASGDGVRLWDVAAGKEIAWLPVGGCRSVHLHPSDGSLLTYGPAGVYRWPVQADPAGGTGGLRVGPPQTLGVPTDVEPHAASLSADGRTLAVADQAHGQALAIDLESKKVLLRGQQLGIDRIVLSPDGRWAAGTTWGVIGGKVRAWDVRDGKVVADLAGPGDVPVAFSPDSQWLLTGGESWRVGSWQSAEPVRPANASGNWNAVCFSRDGKVLALGPWRGAVRLFDPAARQEVATLSTPGKELITNLAFSPEGSLLAVCCQEVIQLWDLRQIRRQLKDMNLDWDLPPYPEQQADGPQPSAPLQVKVDLGELVTQKHPTSPTPNELIEKYTAALKSDPDDAEAYHRRAHAYEKLAQYQKAIEDFTAALQRKPENAHFYEARGKNRLKLNDPAQAAADLQKSLDLKPEQAEACNTLTWLLVAGPVDLRDAQRAVPLAERAVKLEPQKWIYHNTLGLAYYRAGRYQDAIAALENSLRTSGGQSDGFDLYFLAMCHHRLGDAAKARECYDRAVPWSQRNLASLPPEHQQELKAFQAEAEAVLAGKLAPPKP